MKKHELTIEARTNFFTLNKKFILDNVKELTDNLEQIKLLMKSDEFDEILDECFSLTEDIKEKLNNIKDLKLKI